MKNKKIYLLIGFILVASFIYFINNQYVYNVKNNDINNNVIETKEETLDINVINNGGIKIIKGDKELLIDSSLFTDDEKRRIIKNIKQIVEKHDKYLYQSEEFNEDISDFDSFFNEYEYKDNNIYLKHSGDYEIEFSISEAQSINFVNFVSDIIEIEYKPIDVLVKEIDIDPNKPMVAFTFDDGPSVYNTVDIVNKLKEYDSSATFFVLGYKINNNEEILNYIIESGSEIGGHSYDHTSLVELDDEELFEQFNSVKDLVKDKTDNNYEIKTFRPPYGALDDNAVEKSPYPLIMWSYDTLDWKIRKPKKVIDGVMKDLTDGSIYIFHDTHEETKEAVLELIPLIKEQGYQIVSVSQMFNAKGIELKPGVIYHSTNKIIEKE